MSKFYSYRCPKCKREFPGSTPLEFLCGCGYVLDLIEQDETEITQSRAYKIMQRQGQSIAKMLESYVKAFSAEAVHHGITLFNDYVLREYIKPEDIPDTVMKAILEKQITHVLANPGDYR